MGKGILEVANFRDLVITNPGIFEVVFDSKTAEAALYFNVGNRWVRRNLVEYLKSQIKNGEWRDDNPQPIVFSKKGILIDGQHRLMAITESKLVNGKSVKLRVEVGADDEVREYLDTGVPRSLSDRVTFIDDVIINKTIAQLVNWANQYGGRNKRPTPEEAKQFFNEHEEACLFVARNKKRDKGIGSMSVAYAAMEYFEINPQNAVIFYPALAIPDSNVQQARLLRDWLLRARIYTPGNKGQAPRREVYERTVFCMKAHNEGKEIKVIRLGKW